MADITFDSPEFINNSSPSSVSPWGNGNMITAD